MLPGEANSELATKASEPVSPPAPAVAQAASEAEPVAAELATAKPAAATEVTLELPENAKLAAEVDRWSAIVDTLPLTGLSRQLALNAMLHEQSQTDYQVRLAEQHKHLLNDTTKQNLMDALAEALPDAKVQIELCEQTEPTPLQIQQQLDTERANKARAALASDQQLQALQKRFGATMIEDSLQVL